MRKRSKRNKLFWNTAYVFVIIGIGLFIYQASVKVNYAWNWGNVPSYIIYMSEKQISSPVNGFVENYSEDTLTIKSLNNKIIHIKVDHTKLDKGDIVSQGDSVGYDSHYAPGPLLMGLFMTLKISFTSIIAALIIGFVTGLMRVSTNPLFKNLSTTYVELIRGTPLLVQIFIVYFFIGTIFSLDRFVAGAFALATFEGAYIAEIIRAGIQSISKGQTEAALALGMNYFQIMRKIVLPQAVKRTLPALAGQFISLIKDSSLLSIISITELTKAGREVVASTFSPFEIWFSVAALYFIMTYSLSLLDRYIERKFAKSDR